MSSTSRCSLWLWREGPGDRAYWPVRFVFGFCQILIVKTITLEEFVSKQHCWMNDSRNRKKTPECLVCVHVCVRVSASWNPASICCLVLLTDNLQCVKQMNELLFHSLSIWEEVVGVINSSDKSFSESAGVWLVRSGPHRSSQIPDGISEMKQLVSWCCYLANCCRGWRFNVWQQKQKDFQREITVKYWVSSFLGRFKFNLVDFLKVEILPFSLFTSFRVHWKPDMSAKNSHLCQWCFWVA